MKSLPPRVLLAAAATGVQVGAAMVASRAVIGELAPATLAVLRYAIGVLLLLPAWVWMRRRRTGTGRPQEAAQADSRETRAMPLADRGVIAALGVLQFGLPIVMLNAALRHINASLASLLFATFPLMAWALALRLGHERWQLRTLMGLVATVLGVGVALGQGAGAAGGLPWLGAGLALGAAASGALCAILYRPYLARYAALRIGTLAMAASVLALLPLALWEGGPALSAALSGSGWGWVLFVGASSGGGYLLWLWALAHAPASQVTVFLALGPITAALLGRWLLDEAWSWSLGIGLLGVLAGLWLSTRAGTR